MSSQEAATYSADCAFEGRFDPVCRIMLDRWTRTTDTASGLPLVVSGAGLVATRDSIGLSEFRHRVLHRTHRTSLLANGGVFGLAAERLSESDARAREDDPPMCCIALDIHPNLWAAFEQAKQLDCRPSRASWLFLIPSPLPLSDFDSVIWPAFRWSDLPGLLAGTAIALACCCMARLAASPVATRDSLRALDDPAACGPPSQIASASREVWPSSSGPEERQTSLLPPVIWVLQRRVEPAVPPRPSSAVAHSLSMWLARRGSVALPSAADGVAEDGPSRPRSTPSLPSGPTFRLDAQLRSCNQSSPKELLLWAAPSLHLR